jgi:quinol monooxygenase YgiN
MSQISVIAKVPAAPGQRAELAAALQGALNTAEGEAGTRYYILHTDDNDPDLLWMYEMYESKADLDAHMGSEAFQALGGVIGPFLGGRPELIFTKPIGGKGL